MLAAALAMLFFAAVPWVVFPAVVALFPRRRRPLERRRVARSVSVCIPAHNEENVIAAKLENTLALDWGRHAIDIVVCSDGSTDATHKVVRTFADRGVRLVRHEKCLGKPAALATLADNSLGDAILFTDASALLDPDALTHLLDALESPGVGVATARYELHADARSGPERSAFSLDRFQRQHADAHDVLLGASGAAMAMWREFAAPIPTDIVHDDYWFALRAFNAGAAVRYVDAAVARDRIDDPATTLRRYRRIAAGNLQLLRRAPLGNPRVAVPLLLQKLPKMFAPTLGLTALLVAAAAMLDAGLVSMQSPTAIAAFSAVALLLARSSTSVTHIVSIAFALVAGAVTGAFTSVDVRWRGRRPAFDLPQIPRSVEVAKRAFDVVVASVGLFVVSPLLAMIALAIKFDSPGAVLYRQERFRYASTGEPQTFWMWKFRSMRVDAETNGKAQWAAKNDPRVTRVGRFIRATRIDEIPQLVNVLKGDMTIVGPRPERPSFVEQLREALPGYDTRLLRVRPGITGWAQIHCEYDSSLESVQTKVLFDLAYVAHLYRFRSWLKIEATTVLKTFFVMLSGRGAR